MGVSWVKTWSPGWQAESGSREVYLLWGKRSDGATFHIIVPAFQEDSEEVKALGVQQGREMLDTFLDPQCMCAPLKRCKYHVGILGEEGSGGAV